MPSLTPEETLVAENVDLLAEHETELEQTLLDLVRGVKLLRRLKKRHLKQGEEEEPLTDDEWGDVWVYTQPPNPSLLRFAVEQLKGRASQKAQQSQPITIVVQHSVPGHETEPDPPALADQPAPLPLSPSSDDLLDELPDLDLNDLS